ncbi:MAG TPA: flavonol synthase, partial [Brevundimonas sp.]|nr:flavonol synthase [Brevundimonas sp.]
MRAAIFIITEADFTVTSSLTAVSAEDQAKTRAIVPVSMKDYDADFQGFSDALGAS